MALDLSLCGECLQVCLALAVAPADLIITVSLLWQCEEATKCEFCFCKVRMERPFTFQTFLRSQLFLLFSDL